ncbi:C1 family peptidase [Limibacter armeniacum]|uniref:aminopeptidase C n=1 Tax=Limibacter armeniacum TaxID=466084 RepID=UPI002FE508BE
MTKKELVKKIAVAAFATGLTFGAAHAQEEVKLTNNEGSEYQFNVVKSLDATAVKNQGRSGTCWSFSTLSFFETEMERMGKEKIDLSPMFVVRHTYPDKAEKYIRMHGNLNFGAGGAFHDVAYVIKNYGIVPFDVYTGLDENAKRYDHMEMDDVLKGIVDAVVKQKQPSTYWRNAVEGTLDSYVGALPEKFEYNGKEYTPESFAKEVGLNMDDYVSITSYTHHPFYNQFALEVPDNWMGLQSYNLPLDEMMQVMDNALMNGYSIAWGADVSEKGFNYRAGLAIMPEDANTLSVQGKDSKYFNDAGAQKYGEAFIHPVKEKEITQEMRQEAFDNFQTTDDHGMHIVGIAKDQKGTKYYIVKNSWGKSNYCDGYFYASEAYTKYKTMNFMVHRDAIPKELKKKLGIK